MPEEKNNLEQCFLPNFCGLTMVFVVVVIAQVFAFVVVLAPGDLDMAQRWSNLGLISLFVQWCALCSCAALCLARPYICRFSNRKVAIISYAIVLIVVYIVSEASYWYATPLDGLKLTRHHFIFRNLAIAFLLTGPLLRYLYVQFKWSQNVRMEAEARLQSLQSRIRPHFLFNSMNTIASLTRISPEKAERAVEDLADLFRISLRDARQFHSLREEYDICQRYLDIESLRLGDRLQVEWDIGTIPDDAYVPPLLLQPLLENAVYHGIEPRAEGGCIKIVGSMDDKQITLNISNPMPVNAEKASKGNQIAQKNISDRLQALFRSKGKLMVNEENEHYLVTLTWPYRNKIDEDNHY